MSDYYKDHPITDPHKQREPTTRLLCTMQYSNRKRCKNLASIAFIMNHTIYPMCSKCANGSGTAIDKMNLKYMGKTEYKMLSWDSSMEAAYHEQKRSGKVSKEATDRS